MSPKFSVIIPSYNRKEYLFESLDSVLSQTLAPHEIIVYDDGSEDGTREALETFNDRITYQWSLNQGLVIARKNAIAMSSGDWIALLDSDDKWAPEYLAEVAVSQRRFPEAGLLVSNFQNFNDEGATYYDQFASAPDGWWERSTQSSFGRMVLLRDDCYLDYLQFQPGFPSATVFSRQLYNDVGGMNPEVSGLLAEDAHFSRRMAAYGRVCCNFKKRVFVRKHHGNMSGDKARNIKDRIRILELLIHNREIPEHYVAPTMAAIQSWRVEAFDQIFQLGDFTGARQMIRPHQQHRLGARRLVKYVLSFFPALASRFAE